MTQQSLRSVQWASNFCFGVICLIGCLLSALVCLVHVNLVSLIPYETDNLIVTSFYVYHTIPVEKEASHYGEHVHPHIILAHIMEPRVCEIRAFLQMVSNIRDRVCLHTPSLCSQMTIAVFSAILDYLSMKNVLILVIINWSLKISIWMAETIVELLMATMCRLLPRM